MERVWIRRHQEKGVRHGRDGSETAPGGDLDRKRAQIAALLESLIDEMIEEAKQKHG